MTRKQYEQVFIQVINKMRKMTPIDTGNLRQSIKGQWNSPNQFVIYINVGNTFMFTKTRKYAKGQAPYTPFVNEKWISPRWNGRKNPNENFWNNNCEYAISMIAKKLNGELK